MQNKKTVNFLTVTLFLGVLLTLLIYVGMGMLMNEHGNDKTEDAGFNAAFRNEPLFADIIKFADYEIFGHIAGDNIIIGRDEWLFEAVDSENGYERLLDYIGGNPFTQQQLSMLKNKISERHASYAAEGIDYMLIVIPDHVSVCSDKMPWYLGEQSEATRLSQLTSHIEASNIRGFVNPTDKMREESGELVMYNNTENSINAFGAYCIYNTAVAQYLSDTGREVDRIYREDTEFYTRITEGRSIAVKAGLAEVIRNKTVSLTDNMPDDYDVTYNDKGVVVTERISAGAPNNDGVLIECADSWDRSQLMPYFSSTFKSVYYRDSLSRQTYAAEQYGVSLVVQIVHESELEEFITNN